MTRSTPEDARYVSLLADGAAAAAARAQTRTVEAVSALSHRPAMHAVKTLVAAFIGPASPLRGDTALLDAAHRYLGHLERMQLPSGLFDSENLASPPDTAFAVNDGCLVLDVLAAAAASDARAEDVRTRLRDLLGRTAAALRTGGVHTPNHRWELAAALAALSQHVDEPGLVARAEQWLAEGIDQQSDGLYSERSPNYAAHVTNPSLLVLARVLDRPALRDHARRNLEATLPLLDGLDVETIASRRQDLDMRFDARVFLSQFRWFAVADQDAGFADIVARIVAAGPVEPEHHYALALADPVLRELMPSPVPRALPGVVVYPDSRLVRVRADRVVASVFAGSDVPATGRIASGLSTSAVLVRGRMADAHVDAVRVSADFFGLGPFRPEELTSDGPVVTLAGRVRAGYHQPLAPADHDASGRYALGPEPRFFAAMSFDRRQTDVIELATRARVSVGDPTIEIDLSWEGPTTSWTAEILLRPGGELVGAVPLADGSWHLVEGSATYTIGDTTLRIDADRAPGTAPAYDAGELVTAVGGSGALPGVRLLVTGRTDRARTIRLTLV